MASDENDFECQGQEELEKLFVTLLGIHDIALTQQCEFKQWDKTYLRWSY